MSRTNDTLGVEGVHTDSKKPTEAFRENAHQVGQDLKNLGYSAKDVAAQTYDQARQHAGQYLEQGKEKIGHYTGELESYVRDKPVKSLLIAAGVGLVLGMIWKRS